jgi:pimeloyl-ACP methyl ester carboxylesterase
MWDGQTRPLVDHGYRVIAPDQRGFGGTRLWDRAPSLDVVADDVARLLDAEGIRSAVVVGSSMGGYAALSFARRHPRRVAGLVLSATRGDADTAEAAAQREHFAQAIVRSEEDRRQLLAASLPALVGATTHAERPAVVKRVYADAAKASPEALAWAQRAIALRREAFDVLRGARVPAAVIAGEEDALVSPAESRKVAAALPLGRLVTVPRAGHLPALEEPVAFNAALMSTLDSVVAQHTGGRSC